MASTNKDEEFDLNKIDTEIRMEKVRQNASKLTWESFNQELHKNLMSKRPFIDPDAHTDMLNAIVYLKAHMPLNADGNLLAKMKQVAESLECGVTATDACILLQKTELSIAVACTEEQITDVRVIFFDQKAEGWLVSNNLSSEDDLVAFRDGIYSGLTAARAKRWPRPDQDFKFSCLPS